MSRKTWGIINSELHGYRGGVPWYIEKNSIASIPTTVKGGEEQKREERREQYWGKCGISHLARKRHSTYFGIYKRWRLIVKLGLWISKLNFFNKWMRKAIKGFSVQVCENGCILGTIIRQWWIMMPRLFFQFFSISQFRVNEHCKQIRSIHRELKSEFDLFIQFAKRVVKKFK
jgi:hypothetical protein